MDGSHVLTFDEQEMITTAKAAAAAGRLGCIGTPSPAFGQPCHTPAGFSAPEFSSTSSDFTCPSSSPTTAPSTLISAEEQTEQDDAELEELMIPGCLRRQLLSAAYADALGATAPASASMSATVEENGKGVLDALAAEASHRGSSDDENSTEIGNKAPTTPSANTFAPSSTSDTSHSDESVDIRTPSQRVPFKVLEECRSCPCIDDVGDLRFGQGEELERLRKKAPPPLRLGDDIVAEEADVEWSCVFLKEDAGGVDADERTLVCSEVSEVSRVLPRRADVL
ncbi:hypothetical protein F5J12DRAFT_856026 [Pisolithus orientalis]|uniref:uncharacterized protein n=1 Tax=Pisolithus orientalis TaxID=936130 RepID=UPI0022254364|nr:uncharacterized protein F5J12DRAFT_856026 [Pisolithus orientalis]KAI5995315.1 hypothetical protein F5J12DRAFT_856026 [Pisolithus orientalis]